ncbi:unnamed protein product [Lepidochelys kempii]
MTGMGVTWRLRRHCTQEDEGSLLTMMTAGLTWRRPKLQVQPRTKSWAMALKEATHPFDSLLNSSSLRPGASEEEVASAVTLLMQAVKQAMLSTALRSPEMNTQNGRTGSTGTETRVSQGTAVQTAGPQAESSGGDDGHSL